MALGDPVVALSCWPIIQKVDFHVIIQIRRIGGDNEDFRLDTLAVRDTAQTLVN